MKKRKKLFLIAIAILSKLQVIILKKEHYMFLAKTNEDPRPKLLKKLKKCLGNKGSIIVWNQTYEKGVIKELGEDFNEKTWASNINDRVIDLIMPFRNFYYYHPEQEGSNSLKAVLPVLTGRSYKGMEVSNGMEAAIQYFCAMHGNFQGIQTSEKDKQKLFKALEKYCEQDTLAEVWIYEKLRKLSK